MELYVVLLLRLRVVSLPVLYIVQLVIRPVVTPAIEMDRAASTFLLAYDRMQWSTASSSRLILRL
jgi:hypothetical protein